MNWLDFCEESTFRLAEINHLCTSLRPVRLTRLFALILLVSILEIKGLKYLFSDQKIDKYWRFYSNYFDFVTKYWEKPSNFYKIHFQDVGLCFKEILVNFTLILTLTKSGEFVNSSSWRYEILSGCPDTYILYRYIFVNIHVVHTYIQIIILIGQN